MRTLDNNSKQVGLMWRAGSLGTILEEEVEKRIGKIMGMDQGQVQALLAVYCMRENKRIYGFPGQSVIQCIQSI